MRNSDFYKEYRVKRQRDNKIQNQEYKLRMPKKYDRQYCYAPSHERQAQTRNVYEDLTNKYKLQSRNEGRIDKEKFKGKFTYEDPPRQNQRSRISDEKQFLKTYKSTDFRQKNRDRELSKFDSNNSHGKYEMKKSSCNEDDNRIDEMTKKLDLVLKNIKKKSNQLNQWLEPSQKQNKVYQQTKQFKQFNRTHKDKRKYNVDFEQMDKKRKQKDKYEEMKLSLGFTRHLPSEIIFQEPQSQSQNSSRLKIFTKQFTHIFTKLDIHKQGFINKRNFGIQNLSQEFKYLLGAVSTKIKYKNQEFSLQMFIKECKNILKDFKTEEVEEIFIREGVMEKYEKIQNLPNYKQILNDTFGQDTKRSSDMSQVIKKYEFEEERENDFGDNKFTKGRERVNQQDESFHKMCESLNSKLNHYIKSVNFGNMKPSIQLQFSQLSKHWSS